MSDKTRFMWPRYLSHYRYQTAWLQHWWDNMWPMKMQKSYQSGGFWTRYGRSSFPDPPRFISPGRNFEEEKIDQQMIQKWFQKIKIHFKKWKSKNGLGPIWGKIEIQESWLFEGEGVFGTISSKVVGLNENGWHRLFTAMSLTHTQSNVKKFRTFNF